MADDIWRGQGRVGSTGIGHVLLRCSALRPSYCADATTLLYGALGAPQERKQGFTYYRVQPPAYTTAHAPAYLVTPPLFFDTAFGELDIDNAGATMSYANNRVRWTVAIPFAMVCGLSRGNHWESGHGTSV
ncbi:MAG: hypothetical protein R2867_24630 [Caldilineaceae bacterium]